MAKVFEKIAEAGKKWRYLRKLLASCPASEWTRTPASDPHFDRRQYDAVCRKDGFALAVAKVFQDSLQIGVKVEGEAPVYFVVSCPLLPFGAQSDVYNMASAIAERIRENEDRNRKKRENEVLEKAVAFQKN